MERLKLSIFSVLSISLIISGCQSLGLGKSNKFDIVDADPDQVKKCDFVGSFSAKYEAPEPPPEPKKMEEKPKKDKKTAKKDKNDKSKKDSKNVADKSTDKMTSPTGVEPATPKVDPTQVARDEVLEFINLEDGTHVVWKDTIEGSETVEGSGYKCPDPMIAQIEAENKELEEAQKPKGKKKKNQEKNIDLSNVEVDISLDDDDE